MPEKPAPTSSQMLQRAGIDPATAEAVLEIDAVMQQWRRRVVKRELGQRALKDLAVGLDLAQLDVLSVIGPADGDGEGETMVATVAERLGIDPSRASRLVSEMVDAGYARRAVSQADARRSIVQLTPAGTAVIEAVRTYKFLIMGDFLGSWPAADVAAFLPLLQRFEGWSGDTERSAKKYENEIRELAATIPPLPQKRSAQRA